MAASGAGRVFDAAAKLRQVKIFRTRPGERTAARRGAAYRGADDDCRRRSGSAVRRCKTGREAMEMGTNLRTGANQDCWRPLMGTFGANRMY